AGGAGAGVFNVSGNLTITGTGAIACNDPPSPAATGACPMVIHVTGNMEIQNGGALLADNNVGAGTGGAITITVDGSLTLRGNGSSGANISASNNGSGDAGSVTITVGAFTGPPTGDFTMEPGSSLQVNSGASAGAIVINVAHIADVDGLVESRSSLTGVGASQPPGGGPITINAGCSLLVSDAGVVSSAGLDPGADLVHLQSCNVTIDG